MQQNGGAVRTFAHDYATMGQGNQFNLNLKTNIIFQGCVKWAIIKMSLKNFG